MSTGWWLFSIACALLWAFMAGRSYENRRIMRQDWARDGVEAWKKKQQREQEEHEWNMPSLRYAREVLLPQLEDGPVKDQLRRALQQLQPPWKADV
jgi:hypothetical protein